MVKKLVNSIKYFYKFGFRVWNALILGWLGLLLSAFPFLRPDRAGALLVCSAVIAEVFHDNRYRKFVNQFKPGNNQVLNYEVIIDPESGLEMVHTTISTYRVGSRRVNTQDWALFHLAKNEELYQHSDGKKFWDIDRTMERLEKKIDKAIVISALVGTLFWAFA